MIVSFQNDPDNCRGKGELTGHVNFFFPNTNLEEGRPHLRICSNGATTGPKAHPVDPKSAQGSCRQL